MTGSCINENQQRQVQQEHIDNASLIKYLSTDALAQVSRMVEKSVTKLCETAQAHLKEQTQALAMLQKEHVKLAVDKKNELNTVILLVKFLML